MIDDNDDDDDDDDGAMMIVTTMLMVTVVNHHCKCCRGCLAMRHCNVNSIVGTACMHFCRVVAGGTARHAFLPSPPAAPRKASAPSDRRSCHKNMFCGCTAALSGHQSARLYTSRCDECSQASRYAHTAITPRIGPAIITSWMHKRLILAASGWKVLLPRRAQGAAFSNLQNGGRFAGMESERR